MKASHTADPVQLFTKAAAAGHSDAQYYLATLYHDGLGTSRDYRKAMHFFSLASQQSHLLAIYSLATMHAAGTGTARSCDVSVGRALPVYLPILQIYM